MEDKAKFVEAVGQVAKQEKENYDCERLCKNLEFE